jgi:hypothetical protein
VHSRRTSLPPVTRGPAAGPSREADDRPLPEDALEWSWPPYAPVEGEPFPEDDDWAPPSVVWHPSVRLGRWTVVYRRSVC